MQFSNAVSYLLLALSVQLTNAHLGSGGKRGGNRPFGGGPNGNRPGFPGFMTKPELTTLTCTDDFVCDHRGGEQGTFVCRTLYHPITGNNMTDVKCIPNDRAWTTDQCGCCGGDCPVQPEFIEISCDDQDDLDLGDGNTAQVARSGNQKPGDQGQGRRVVVCRDVFNPFTGDPTSVSIRIRSDRSLLGDSCGCCDGVCPEKGEPLFERPDQVELDWCSNDELVNCTIPKRKGGRDDDKQEELDEDEQDRQGVFVCRSMANMLTGVAESQPVCIPTDRAWETDQCGCCGEECPLRPERTGIDCIAEEEQCERRNGEAGVFVCRSLFHPIDRTVIEHPLCIPSENAWATDQCGCCGSDCPTTPTGGFDSEDSQLLSLALEESSEGEDESSDAFHARTTSFLSVLGLLATAILTF